MKIHTSVRWFEPFLNLRIMDDVAANSVHLSRFRWIFPQLEWTFEILNVFHDSLPPRPVEEGDGYLWRRYTTRHGPDCHGNTRSDRDWLHVDGKLKTRWMPLSEFLEAWELCYIKATRTIPRIKYKEHTPFVNASNFVLDCRVTNC